MKIVAKREEIHRNDFGFNRTEYTDGSYMWNDFKGFTTYWNGKKHVNWSDILEPEYQKITSNQDANLSKASLNDLELDFKIAIQVNGRDKNFFTQEQIARTWEAFLRLVNAGFANGESPEEGNPVAQITERDILNNELFKQAICIFEYNKHRPQFAAHIANIFNDLISNKALETDKEQPIFLWKLYIRSKEKQNITWIMLERNTISKINDYVNKVNQGNYSYTVYDLEKIG